MIPTSSLQANDCLRACVASILAVPPESLPAPPVPITDDNWTEYAEVLRDAIREYGYELLILDPAKSFDGAVPRGLSIASFPSPGGGDILHSVVCHNGAVLWDPSPEYRTQGVTYKGVPNDWIVFQALEPAALGLRRSE